MIGFELKVDKKKVENRIYELIKETAPNSKLEISGFEVILEILGAPNLELTGKNIFTSFPIAVSFVKDAALFTVKGHGKLNIQMATAFDINPNFGLTTKSKIEKYEWVEKPVIDFGSLDITVEKLIGLVLNHYDDMIGATIDKSIKDALNLKDLVNSAIGKLRTQLSKFSFKGINLFIEPSELLLEPIETDNYNFKAKGSLRADVAFATSNPFEDTGFTLRWVETLLSDNITYIHFDITEEIISNILCEFVNEQEYGGEKLVSDNCKVDFSPGKININLNLIKPINAAVLLYGNPRYNEHESKLYLDNLDIDMKASNFIYKLTSGLISKYMESKIKENLPVDVDYLIKSQLSKIISGSQVFNEFTIQHSISSIKLMELVTHDKGIKALMVINDGELKVIG